MSLYQEYRPDSFEGVLGNTETVEALKNMVSSKEKCPHAFLLSGPTGCGKTTLGRILASELGCVGNDFREVDSADFRGIDTVREIRKQANYKPLEGKTRVWLIDECHKMTNDAQNALLKILEDTPSHVYFILATTEPEKLLGTIKGRCSSFQVRQLTEKEMIRLLRSVVKAEEESLEKEVYYQIYQDSLGHPRNAMTILEQVLNVEPELRLETAKRTAEQQSQSIELCRALIGKKGWKTVSAILTGLKTQDPEGIRRQVLGYAQSILLKGENSQAALVMEEFIEPFYNSGFPGLTFACYSIVKG